MELVKSLNSAKDHWPKSFGQTLLEVFDGMWDLKVPTTLFLQTAGIAQGHCQ